MGQYASPYVGMGNNPINRIDPDGGEDGGPGCGCGPGFFKRLFNKIGDFFQSNFGRYRARSERASARIRSRYQNNSPWYDRKFQGQPVVSVFDAIDMKDYILDPPEIKAGPIVVVTSADVTSRRRTGPSFEIGQEPRRSFNGQINLSGSTSFFAPHGNLRISNDNVTRTTMSRIANTLLGDDCLKVVITLGTIDGSGKVPIVRGGSTFFVPPTAEHIKWYSDEVKLQEATVKRMLKDLGIDPSRVRTTQRPVQNIRTNITFVRDCND
jgi:hypothetical protein